MDLIATKIKQFKIWAVVYSIALLIFFVLDSQYAAYHALEFILVGVFLFPLVIFNMIRALILLVENFRREGASHPFMIYMLCILLVICLPGEDHSKQYFKDRVPIDQHKNLYLETYCIAAGFLTTDIDAAYLTDRNNFRLFLGTYVEDGEIIRLKIVGDSITIMEPQHLPIDPNHRQPNLRRQRLFSLTILQQQHIFE